MIPMIAAKLCLILYILPLAAALSQDRLSLDIIFDKDEFLKGELIHCGIELTNTGVTDLEVIKPRNWYGIRFKLFDADGKELDYTGPMIHVREQPRYTLKTGETIFWVEDINMLFGYLINLSTYTKIINEGRYTLTAAYRPGNGDTIDAEANFSIVKPSGEEAAAYREFMDILYDVHSAGEIRNHEKLLSRLLDFEDNHPQSVYTPIILNIVRSIYRIPFRQEDKAWETYKRMLQKYPDFAVLKHALFDSYLSDIKDEEERQNFIEQLQTSLESPLSIRFLQTLIKKHGFQ